jgi:DNA repair exonuclease SbcCD ATPase subunit
MSPLLASQAQQNRAIDGNVSDNMNGLEKDLDNGTQGSPSSISFGMLHERVRSEVNKLEGGLESVAEAVSTLAKTFREQEHMIHIAQERFGKDQDLEREILALKAGNAEMWRLRNEEAEQHRSRVLELEEEAKEVQKQKKSNEWQSIKLRDEYQKKEQAMKREYREKQQQDQEELEQRKAKLESDNETKIAELEATQLALTKANQKLKKELQDKSNELENEKAIWQRVRTGLYEEVNHVKGALKQIETKYAVEERSLEY